MNIDALKITKAFNYDFLNFKKTNDSFLQKAVYTRASQMELVLKELTYQCRDIIDVGWIPASGRSLKKEIAIHTYILTFTEKLADNLVEL